MAGRPVVCAPTARMDDAPARSLVNRRLLPAFDHDDGGQVALHLHLKPFTVLAEWLQRGVATRRTWNYLDVPGKR